MKQGPRVVLGVTIMIAAWVVIDGIRGDPPSPSAGSVRTTSLAEPAPVPAPSADRGVAQPTQRPAEPYQPVLATTSGRTVITDGLDVLSFVTKMSPAARAGDAVAAYRVYQAEAMCASLDGLMRMDLSPADADERQRHAAYVAKMTEACNGVTPAQQGERFTFLDQAIRAGNQQAMIDYCVEGPNGRQVTDFDPRDPLVVAWKQKANAYLQQLASKGNQDAWVMLAQNYDSGIVIERDLAAALGWWTAIEVSREPDTDPLSIAFIGDLARQLPTEAAQQAIAQGRSLGLQFPRKRRSV